MLALALLNLALADVPRDQLTLSTDRLALGVHTDGSLINQAAGLGLIWDPDGPDGTTPAGGDWLMAGRALEAWAMTAEVAGEEQTWTNAGARDDSAFTLDWERVAEGPDALALRGVGADETVEVEQWVVVWPDQDAVGLLLVIHALTDLTDLRVSRALDPDPDYGFDGSAVTLNEGGDGVASASGTLDGRTVALASPGGVGALCSWCTSPDELLAGRPGPETGDDQIGVAVSLGSLAAGETLAVPFALALDLDATSARDAAVALAATLSADLDGDGLSAAEGDCDEGSAGASPGASQQWNGADDDCDGEIDEESVGSDDDGDGVTEAEGDCDDDDPEVYPGAPPGDGDADCDGQPDDGDWGEVPEGVEKTGGCATGAARPGEPTLLALLLMASLIWRRR